MLAAGASADLCDPVALLTLTRIGLVKGLRLTPAADQLQQAALLHEHRNTRGHKQPSLSPKAMLSDGHDVTAMHPKVHPDNGQMQRPLRHVRFVPILLLQSRKSNTSKISRMPIFILCFVSLSTPLRRSVIDFDEAIWSLTSLRVKRFAFC